MYRWLRSNIRIGGICQVVCVFWWLNGANKNLDVYFSSVLFSSLVPATLCIFFLSLSQATELVLNNLFYLTLHLAECPSATDYLKQLWITLVRYRPSNLRVILRYLIVITSVAPATLLSHVSRLFHWILLSVFFFDCRQSSWMHYSLRSWQFWIATSLFRNQFPPYCTIFLNPIDGDFCFVMFQSLRQLLSTLKFQPSYPRNSLTPSKFFLAT